MLSYWLRACCPFVHCPLPPFSSYSQGLIKGGGHRESPPPPPPPPPPPDELPPTPRAFYIITTSPPPPPPTPPQGLQGVKKHPFSASLLYHFCMPSSQQQCMVTLHIPQTTPICHKYHDIAISALQIIPLSSALQIIPLSSFRVSGCPVQTPFPP